jgi:hypothetical protein
VLLVVPVAAVALAFLRGGLGGSTAPLFSLLWLVGAAGVLLTYVESIGRR